MKIKAEKIGILSFARFQALLMSFLGLIAGILYSFGGAVYDMVSTEGVNGGTGLAFLSLLGMPAVFAVSGFFAGLIEASVYNLFARRFGGLEIDLN